MDKIITYLEFYISIFILLGISLKNEKISDKAQVSGYQRNGEYTMSGKKSSFCIAKIPSNNGENSSLKGYYYKIYVFYQLDIPIINAIFNFSALGETKLLYW